MNTIPVITIDGPSGTGKGTLAKRLTDVLGWHWLDSGALYRGLAIGVLKANLDEQDIDKLAQLLPTLNIQMNFDACQVFCNGVDVTADLRLETVSSMASRLGAIPLVRQRLLELQRQARQLPGLVTDGRDMGTVIFPDAKLKFFLTASVEERAERRFRQLQALGIPANLPAIRSELEARDERDRERSIAPTLPAQDAIVIDTTSLSVDQVFDCMMQSVQKTGALI